MTKTCLSFFYIYKMRSEQKIDVSWSVSACISFIFLFTLWHYDLSGILRTIWHASRLVLYSLTWFETKIPCKMVVIMQSIYSFRKLCITFKKGVTVLFVVSPYFTRRDIYFLLNTHLKVKTQFSVWTPFFPLYIFVRQHNSEHLWSQASVCIILSVSSRLFTPTSVGLGVSCSQLLLMVSFSLSLCFVAGTSYSPQENSHNHSSLHSSNSHSNPSKNSDTVSFALIMV